MLNGILYSKANVSDSLISFNTENSETAEFTLSLIAEAFGKTAEVASPEKGGRCKTVKFSSKAARGLILESENSDSIAFMPKCTLCRMAFLRGIFFACGRLTDPQKQFCLEFSLGNRAERFIEYFVILGLEFKLSERRSERILYTKNSTVIEDFLSLAELNNAAFEIMNIKIANELKNNANRLRNFDTVNITKAVDAANSQIVVIRELYERNLLGSLPPELEATARMRLENPDMSLAQLAIHSVPAVTKSGITHRLKKIMEFGEKLLDKE
jgi:DNA-binding protein WhiA